MASLPDIVPNINLPSSRLSLYLTAGFTSLGLLYFLKSLSSPLLLNKPQPTTLAPSPDVKIIPSPLRTVLPSLSEAEIKDLPYPPDALPGARDVETPYGSIRVYEWGPEDGKRVLFVHGISTPCIALAGVADKLAQKGCRVMLFDLFGRGYSDAPSDVPYDNRLYATQIHLVLSSSPVCWISEEIDFSLIGYSLGGGICADFTSYFPRLVSSLILIAPGGIVRTSHISLKSRLLYSNLLPEPLVHWLVRRRLRYGPSVTNTIEPETTEAVHAELGKGRRKSVQLRRASSYAPVDNDHLPLIQSWPNVTIAGAVNWQIDHHDGFIPAFVSSIRYAPIHEQHARWRVIGERLSRQEANFRDEEALRLGLWRRKVLILLGAADPIVIKEEVEADAEEVLGKEHTKVVVFDAGHEVPISHSHEVVDTLWKFWGEEIEDIEIELDEGI